MGLAGGLGDPCEAVPRPPRPIVAAAAGGCRADKPIRTRCSRPAAKAARIAPSARDDLASHGEPRAPRERSTPGCCHGAAGAMRGCLGVAGVGLRSRDAAAGSA